MNALLSEESPDQAWQQIRPLLDGRVEPPGQCGMLQEAGGFPRQFRKHPF